MKEMICTNHDVGKLAGGWRGGDGGSLPVPLLHRQSQPCPPLQHTLIVENTLNYDNDQT